MTKRTVTFKTKCGVYDTFEVRVWETEHWGQGEYGLEPYYITHIRGAHVEISAQDLPWSVFVTAITERHGCDPSEVTVG